MHSSAPPLPRHTLVVLVVGVALAVGGPTLGFASTLLGMTNVFDVVSAAPAESKATLLSAGIATAMRWTLIGIGTGAVGAAVGIAVTLWTRRSPASPHA